VRQRARPSLETTARGRTHCKKNLRGRGKQFGRCGLPKDQSAINTTVWGSGKRSGGEKKKKGRAGREKERGESNYPVNSDRDATSLIIYRLYGVGVPDIFTEGLISEKRSQCEIRPRSKESFRLTIYRRIYFSSGKDVEKGGSVVQEKGRSLTSQQKQQGNLDFRRDIRWGKNLQKIQLSGGQGARLL